jgi:hypothetical protein
VAEHRAKTWKPHPTVDLPGFTAQSPMTAA